MTWRASNQALPVVGCNEDSVQVAPLAKFTVVQGDPALVQDIGAQLEI
jgi:hypothetical protein